MEVRFTVKGRTSGEDLVSLAGWLRKEPELRGRVSKLASEDADGDLGGAWDVVAVAVGSGGAASVLARSIQTWLSQPRRSDVIVRVHRPDGTFVEVDAKRTEVDLKDVIAQVIQAGRVGDDR